jgi:hypothetical protein
MFHSRLLEAHNVRISNEKTKYVGLLINLGKGEAVAIPRNNAQRTGGYTRTCCGSYEKWVRCGQPERRGRWGHGHRVHHGHLDHGRGSMCVLELSQIQIQTLGRLREGGRGAVLSG